MPRAVICVRKPGVVAVTGIHQHHALGQSGGAGRFELLEGDLRLGLESERLRYLSLAPTRLILILCPILGQIELISDR